MNVSYINEQITLFCAATQSGKNITTFQGKKSKISSYHALSYIYNLLLLSKEKKLLVSKNSYVKKHKMNDRKFKSVFFLSSGKSVKFLSRKEILLLTDKKYFNRKTTI